MEIKKLSFKTKTDNEQLLPDSSQPQDLGSISYKDSSTSETSQQTQSVETTASIITETFVSEEKILPDLDERKTI